MCFLNIYSFYQDEPLEHLPRAIPRLAWAVPVDIVELGVSLEAYLKSEEAILALRICHRFRNGPLSLLPQELLEQVVDEVYLLDINRNRISWTKQFACFQDRCNHEYEYEPGDEETERLWRELYAECPDNPLNPSDYTAEERADMLTEYFIDVFWSEDIRYEAHNESKDAWLERTCLCQAKNEWKGGGFLKLNQILKSNFGLEAFVVHEVMSNAMYKFLPDTQYSIGNDDYAYYTRAYLILGSGEDGENRKNCLQTQVHHQYAAKGDHLAFTQGVDPSSLVLSDAQRRRFVRAMRILRLKPHYHLTQLESLVTPTIKDPTLEEMSEGRVGLRSCQKKSAKLQKYLDEKSKELTDQSWPRLMMLASSDAVTPRGWHLP